MQYREILPQPPLNRVVECFWTLEGQTTPAAAEPERILPDGCVELILNFGDEFKQHDDGILKLQPRNFVVGQMTGPVFISPTGKVELLGIRFHPGGTRPFLEMPLHEITDQIVELGSLASRFERELLEVCAAAPTLADRVAAVRAYLCNRLPGAEHDFRLTALARTIVARRGLVSVDQLAAEAGVSCRQLERRFLREVGVGPKLLARILRFQQVFRAVEQSNAEWAAVAVECGYYDQAHLIRDFNQFARQTPAVLFASQSLLTASFTRKSRESDFSNTAG